MMSMYDCIKEQWQWGCYTDPSQLDIYVQVGWITEAQKEEIVHSTDVPDESTDTGTTTEQPAGTTNTAPAGNTTATA